MVWGTSLALGEVLREVWVGVGIGLALGEGWVELGWVVRILVGATCQ